MSALELQVYDILKSRFGETEASKFIEYFESKADQKYQKKKDLLATKEDVAKLESKIAESKADTLKWMIVLFAPFHVGMIVFLVKLFLH